MNNKKIILILSAIFGSIVILSTSCEAPMRNKNLFTQANAIVCTKRRLTTLTPQHLIVSTSKPGFAPWVIDDNPANHKGFESAIIYALARELGFNDKDILWVRGTFASIFIPGRKNFDLAIDQISINAERAKNIDFSAPYYSSSQVIIVKKTNKYAHSHSLEELRTARIGAMDQTTAVSILMHSFHTTRAPKVYDTQLDTLAALNNNQIDAMITDTPTAEHMVKYQIPQGKILGVLPPQISPEQHFGIVLDKNSPLTSCTTWAVNKLRSTGKLAILTRKWIGSPPITELTVKR